MRPMGLVLTALTAPAALPVVCSAVMDPPLRLLTGVGPLAGHAVAAKVVTAPKGAVTLAGTEVDGAEAADMPKAAK